MLLALYFVTTTRWGSYLLPGPPYIGDLALAVLIGHRVWTIARRSAPAPLLGRAVSIATALLLLLSVAALLTGDLTVTALRDGAPYFYAVLVFFGQSYRAIPPRTIQFLVFGALVLHAMWYSVQEFLPSLITVPTLGDSSVLLFGGRADIDGACLAVLVALALDRTITGQTRLLSSAVAAWALVLVLLTQSRASFLTAGAVLAFLLLRHTVIYLSSRKKGASGSLSMGRMPGQGASPLNAAIAVAVVAAASLGVTLISGPPAALERSISTADVADTTPSGDGQVSPTYSASFATAAARTAGWDAVLDWLPDGGAPRIALGVGFGPHYMQLSGADVAFLGPAADPSVRAIHNFGLNTWARLGLVGVILVAIITLLSLVAAVRLSTRALIPPDLDLFASLVVIVIPLVALLGVVLESPFGAIPYFWAVGYLSARMVEEGLWKPLKSPLGYRRG